MQSDEDLIFEYINGVDDSFKVLVDRYIASIYNFSIRFVGNDYANDITQDVFLRVWKNIRKFNHKKANFKTWLFTIARNTITDYLRKKKSISFSSLNTEEENFEETIEDEVILPDEAMSKLEDKEFLNKLLDEIPGRYKEVLILYYQECMTFNEIGQLLDKPLNTVKSYHYRALSLLRKLIEGRDI
jgi:RNA polymerase sigma-70 factor (ECF subfamily)